ncbi:MAG: glycosyltransferase [Chroococcus sp. CMT-3BRIN-NPC107]|jgi:colanic acid/amylovoran biosynthesis glycosyltransferase|nr:glycosyltransferase [Chroococcus sp. CMT-3BRIN-NPC107]
MKVAFIVWEFPSLSETFILNQIVGLIERGHEVDIFACNGSSVNFSKCHPDVEKYQLLNRTYYPPKRSSSRWSRFLKGVELLVTNYSKNPLSLTNSLNVFKYGKKAASLQLLYLSIPLLANKESYDIIHCQFGTTGLIGMSLRDTGILKGKLVTSFRGSDISKYVQKFGDKVYNQLFSKGDFFLTNCEYFKHRLVKLGCQENKICVLRSGIDCSQFIFTLHAPPPDGRIRVVTTGRLVEKKGIEYSIRAVAKLKTIHPNIEYQIIGDGPLRQDLEQLIQELDVGNTVTILGWKQQQELIEILNNSHILIATSVSSSDGDQDAPVNVLKEAMAIGLPVIGTQHGGIPELITDGVSGFLVPERDVDTLAEKLSYLIEHPEIWAAMGRAGRQCVEQEYNNTKLNGRLVEVYEHLLAV